MKIEAIYDTGTASPQEDQLIFKQPFFFGVADGVSGLYLPEEGPTLYEGRTGGQMVCDVLLKTIVTASPKESLLRIMLNANQAIAAHQTYPLEESEMLGGATFAVAKFTNEQIIIIQAGDCFALWVSKNGKIGITKNQVFHHDTQMRQEIARLMEKHGGNQQKMWQEFRPFLAHYRRQQMNNKNHPHGYGVLNGQPNAKEMWAEFILFREEIKLLLLFTDGLIYYSDSEKEQFFAEKVYELYKKGGLGTILKETRIAEEKEKTTSHIDHAEATAIAIEF